mgnify:CR=1 FL=1
MGGGDIAVSRRVPLLLAALFLASFIPSAHAVSGAGVIDVDSFGLADYETFSSENYSFTLELHETDGGFAEVDLDVDVKTLEGILIQSLPSQSFNLSSMEQRNVTITLTSMDYGYSEVHVVLTGDVGVESGTQLLNISRTIQRLRPLSLELGGAGSLLSQGIDSLGTPTGNLSVHDGDYIQIQLPIINQGDVNWTGSVDVIIENGGQNESIVIGSINVDAMSSTYANATPSFQLVEGDLAWSFALNGTLGDDNGHHMRNGTVAILPPPLPYLTTLLTSNAANITAGDDLVFDLNVTNNGTVDFSGILQCSSPNEILLTTSEQIVSGQSFSWQFTMTAKPVTIECILQEGRVSALSTLPHELVVDMASASFASAGSTTPSLIGGPWHHGDSLRANMLIRNIGEIEGRVRMVLFDQGDSTQQNSVGEWVILASGEAGEVSSDFLFLRAGEHLLDWALESDDGSVVGVYGGNFTLPVGQQQSIGIDIDNVVWSQDSGLSFEIAFEMDEGKSRDVFVQLGYETSEETVYLYEYVRTFEQGVHGEQISFGQVSAEKVILKISAEGWSIGPGPLSVTAYVPDERTIYWIEIEEVPDPILPVEGEEATLKLTLHQSGPQSTSVGEIILKDAYDEILSTVTSPEWGSAQSVTVEMDLIWPKGSNVVIQAVWSVNGELITEQESYVSGDSVGEKSESMPVGAIIWGLVGGILISLILRVRMNRVKGPDDGKSVTPKPKQKAVITSSRQQKIEVQCPQCERRLRVPSDYSGSVGCPDCSTKFAVEGEKPAPDEKDLAPEEAPEIVTPPSPEPKESKDGKVEISCPDCSQTLRIPGSYEGSVRCPACSKVFKSLDRK